MEADNASQLLNPFVVGGALRDRDGYGFFGREDVFLFVKQALYAVQRVPIVLYGHRRIGKSSILRQLAYKFSPELICVYHDLQGSANDPLDSALYGLARDIADKLGMPRPTPMDTASDLFAENFMSRVATHIGDLRRLVLLMDEFDAVDERKNQPTTAAKDLIPFLGRLTATDLNFGLILVLGRRSSELSESFKNWILKDSLQMQIGRLTKAQTVQMIDELSRPHLSFQPAAMDRIYELAAGHPFCSQVLCYAVWDRCIDQGVSVRIADVEASIADAIGKGANGMTWIYDGLELAEQRLFVSTLSETADPLSGRPSSLHDIQRFLRDYHLSVGQADLDSAARELVDWDIITGSNDIGYRFSVPLLGAWVRRERPMFQLEQAIQFANPRAWTFYELARESERRGDLTAALADYSNALIENPVFLEAQRRMATVLQRRGDPGDLLRAIEEWERVLELDSGSPRSEILDALMLALDSTQNTPRSVWLSQKIAKFDTTDQVKERAKRTLLRRAAAKMEGGSRSAVKNAIKLFEAAGDSENAAVASSLAARQEKIENLGVATFFTAIGLAIVLGLLPVSARLADLQILLCAVAGVTILWGDRSQRDGNLSIRHAGLLGIPIGMVIGEVVLFLINDMIVVGWLTVLAAGIAGNWNAPKFVMDIEGDPLKPTEPAKGILLRLLDSFIKKLLQLRDRLAQRAMRKAELKG